VEDGLTACSWLLAVNSCLASAQTDKTHNYFPLVHQRILPSGTPSVIDGMGWRERGGGKWRRGVEGGGLHLYVVFVNVYR